MTVKSRRSHYLQRDPDEAPEITNRWITAAALHHGKKLVRRGRPAGSGQEKLHNSMRMAQIPW